MFSKAINFNTYKSCENIYRERWADWARNKRCISVLFLHCWRRKLVSRFTRPTFSLLPDSSLRASHRQNARLLNTYIMFKCYFQQQDVSYGGKYFNAVSKHCNASGTRWNSSVPWGKRWALGTFSIRLLACYSHYHSSWFNFYFSGIKHIMLEHHPSICISK